MEANLVDVLISIWLLVAAMMGAVVGATRLALPVAAFLAIATAFHSYSQFQGLFGTDPGAQLFVFLLLAFFVLVVLSLLSRVVGGAVRASGLSPLDRLMGVALAMILAAFVAGEAVWAIQKYGDAQARSLLRESKLAEPALQFFSQVMLFAQRLLPTEKSPAPLKEAWWKRPLWSSLKQ